MAVRTLIVDDSPTMRALIAGMLSRDPDIEVVGAANGPHQAREMIKALDPDVITLDVEMPDMNGLDFLERVMRLRPMPVVMLSTLTQAGADTTIRALELGAVECCAKPATNCIDPRIAESVKAAASSRRIRVRDMAPAAPTPMADFKPIPGSLIAIGASTGGVEALIQVLSGFPANCPPTVICQHMPATFTTSFAARLDRLSKPTVTEARHGQPLVAGHVYLAPGGTHHMEVGGVDGQYRARLIPDDPVSGHRPSVDRLFHSVAKTVGAKAVGAILTGMGRDGADGLLAMRGKGCMTIGQDRDSCVVYGMPGVAQDIGAVTRQLTLTRIAPALIDRCRA
ncbi:MULTISPECIES: chemotaxis response regulator protein-glutamate methylesterase [Sphingomonas]|jgi:two-component system chemotaxis response regulator CheB|uniref:Protein-glutamate methylesterase/protein-glutamine glutaminase n=3 Tax=Sphingomonas TaxID=13687 RepID=A0A0A1W5Q1_9SPHN|nr:MULTISPECIES: chemotaxis response regulator protein-glutamate methylesterase [Sphingomonas]APX64641.1 chemotaxis response regulator protein-glutamate methylesterase [Sphingomonas sp. LK11]KQO51287.1 chemotaxis protein [Sphingomonas sp. Leaf257]MBB4609677.1 two-component system chemotaxis response regulator CheB [Sphingomonas yabuuchiae]MBN3557989.1 chemotaxis response regulator protein-glutamate methylesterase [Sphingomonas yabuuchiae]OMJ30893.1 chemotaxis response regulator protein-glutama